MSAPQTPPPSPSSRRAVREERERETADNKITITACTASIPSERRAEGLICVSPGSVERKPPLSLCYQLSGLVEECPAHTKDYGNDTQCLPARHLGFHPRPGHTRVYENGTHCRGAWHSVFRVGLGGFRSTTDFFEHGTPAAPSGDAGSNAEDNFLTLRHVTITGT